MRKRVTELEAANAGLKAENTQLGRAVAEVKAENTRLMRGMTELESDNSLLGKNVARVKAENADLRGDVTDLRERIERMERGGAPDVTLASAHAKELGSKEIAEKASKRQPDRPEWKSNEALGLAAAVGGGVITTMADYWSALPASYAGIAASAMGIGTAAVGWYRKHREVKDAHRPKH